jgi:hypothetical protein
MINVAVTNRKNAFVLIMYVVCIALCDAIALCNIELGMWGPIQRRSTYRVFRELPPWNSDAVTTCGMTPLPPSHLPVAGDQINGLGWVENGVIRSVLALLTLTYCLLNHILIHVILD